MKKPQRKEVSRIDVGIAIFGGTISPHSAYQLYRIMWSDGTSTIESGRSIASLPEASLEGSKPRRDIRPDLQAHMQAAQILIQPISRACWDLDQPVVKPKKRKRKVK